MIAIIVAVILWVFCSLPFILLGFPPEASLLFGFAVGMIVAVHMGDNSGEESAVQASPQHTAHQSGRRNRSSCTLSNDPHGDGVDEMVGLDMMDGDFGFFDGD